MTFSEYLLAKGKHILHAHFFQKISASTGPSETLHQKFIDLLTKAGIIIGVLHSQRGGLPLRATASESTLKLFLLDVGIYNARMGVQWSDLYQLHEEDLLTKGKMAEQFIAQHLLF
jgi:predicted AAA+ superfamily ATPase